MQRELDSMVLNCTEQMDTSLMNSWETLLTKGQMTMVVQLKTNQDSFLKYSISWLKSSEQEEQVSSFHLPMTTTQWMIQIHSVLLNIFWSNSTKEIFPLLRLVKVFLSTQTLKLLKRDELCSMVTSHTSLLEKASESTLTEFGLQMVDLWETLLRQLFRMSLLMLYHLETSIARMIT